MSRFRALVSDRRYLVQLAVLAVVYYVAGKFGLSLAFKNISASPVWPPTGIAIGSLLLFGYRLWPAVFVGAFLTNITTQGSVPVVLGIATGNTLEGVVGAYLINRFAGGSNAFDRVNDAIRFVFLGTAAAAVSATVGVLSLQLGGFSERADFWPVWLTWWTGDATGCIMVGSLIILLWQPSSIRWSIRKVLEAILLFQSLAVVGMLSFSDLLLAQSSQYRLQFLCIPFIMWAAFRFARHGAVIAVLLFSGIAIWGTLNGYGPFVLVSENASLLVLQMFMGIVTVGGMVLAVALGELRKANAALRQSYFRSDMSLRLLVDSVREVAIFLIDPKGNIMTWNTGAEHLSGYAASDVLGRDFAMFYAPEDRKAGKLVALLRTAETEGFAKDEGWRLRKDKSKYWADAVITALRNPDGSLFGYAKVVRDMTERREQELSRSAFVSAASHELRTPLSAIRWNLELLSEERDLAPLQQKELVDEALRQSGYMSDILQTLLTLSLIEEGKMPVQNKPVTVTALLEQIEKIHRVALDKANVTLSVRCPPRFTIVADSNIVKEVLSNFISNAIKYTPPGGTVTVCVEQRNHDMLFSVTDTGIGISKEEQRHIFDRFFRAKNAQKTAPEGGSGLGLYLARALVRYVGGTIGFESAENTGSTFWFAVPLTPQ